MLIVFYYKINLWEVISYIPLHYTKLLYYLKITILICLPLYQITLGLIYLFTYLFYIFILFIVQIITYHIYGNKTVCLNSNKYMRIHPKEIR